ncbi:MAG: cell division protein FtsZ [Candidatus Heimdallarchaeota archaeon]
MERSVLNNKYANEKSALRDYVSKQQRKPMHKPVKKPLGKTNCYVIGVGGGGNNTINRLMSTGIKDAFCICINTDLQHLESVKCDSTLLIGKKTTRGLGSGGKPELGKAAAEESYSDIQRTISDADIIFLTCGLGGGTGTGAMPIIAEIAKNAGAIVISVVTIPFSIEGSRKEKAFTGLDTLQKNSDTVVIIENDMLLELVPDLPIEEAFSVADEVLANYIYSIISTVSQPGLINVDFADLKSIIAKGGVTVCGVGEAQGEDRAVKAVQKALENPLVNINYNLGNAALIHVTGGSTMSLKEASSVVEIIREKIQPDAEVIWGTKVDHELGDVLRIIIVISGVESEQIMSMHKRPATYLTPPYDVVAGQSTIGQIRPQREKENWLRKDTKPNLRDLRRKLKETTKERKETPEKIIQKEKTSEFWDELGISKGLD